jgi:hypothetical protein
MQGVFLAKTAEFLFLELLLLLPLIYLRNVVTALTLCALQSNNIGHLKNASKLTWQ